MTKNDEIERFFEEYNESNNKRKNKTVYQNTIGNSENDNIFRAVSFNGGESKKAMDKIYLSMSERSHKNKASCMSNIEYLKSLNLSFVYVIENSREIHYSDDMDKRARLDVLMKPMEREYNLVRLQSNDVDVFVYDNVSYDE